MIESIVERKWCFIEDLKCKKWTGSQNHFWNMFLDTLKPYLLYYASGISKQKMILSI